MKYEIFKKLNKQKKEEYNFYKSNNKIYSPNIVMSFVFFLLFSSIMFMMMLISIYLVENHSENIDIIKNITAYFNLIEFFSYITIFILLIELFNILYREYKIYKLTKND